MNRASVRFAIKALDDDARTIEGWATTPDVDRVGDIVMPRGAEYELPIPFLLDHDHDQVVGEVNRVEVTDQGIKFWASIKKITEEGEAKALCDKAWSYIKHGLRKAVSIGFRPLPGGIEALPSGGLKFTSWEWFELSAVGIPAQANARITNAKNFPGGEIFTAEDPEIPEPAPAATGKSVRVVRLDEPARDGAKPFIMRSIKRAKS
jgi:uncharacterized protein